MNSRTRIQPFSSRRIDATPGGPPARRGILPRGIVLLGLCLAAGISVCAAEGPGVIDASRYPTLQAAFDAVPATGGVVRLPPGEFVLTEPLLLTSGDTRIEGAGDATRLINRNTNGQPALVVRPKDIAAKPRSRIWRVQLAAFRISGTTNSGDGILLHGVQELLLQGLSVDHHGGDGVHTVDCAENPRMVGCNITYNAGAGLHAMGAHDFIVNANQFEENRDAVRFIDGFNLCMTGNNVDDHLRHGVVIENTYGSVLSGNMIEECNGTAVILDRDCYGITLSANVIAHHLGGGVHLLDAWGCAVSANTFVLVHSNSVLVGAGSGRIVLTGNSVGNSHVGAGVERRSAGGKKPMDLDEATGFLLDGTADVVVSGNSFSGLSGPAVTARGACRGLLVFGNLVTDFGRRLPTGQPAIDAGQATESVIRDNLVR